MDPLLHQPVVAHQSTAEQVAGLLRDVLLRGEVPPGTKFPEKALAAAYGVSRNTMREALLVLRGQGLIRHQLHRGAVVAELDDDDIVAVMQARRTLERAGTAAATNASQQELAPLIAAYDEMRAAETAFAFLRADQRFHAAIVGCLKSRHLDRFFAGIQTEQALVRAWRGETADRQHTIGSHGAVLQAILDRNGTLADELIGVLIDNAEKRLRQLASDPTAGSESNSKQD